MNHARPADGFSLPCGRFWSPCCLWLAALFFGTNGCGLIGFHYPRAVENDPLLAPIRVVSVQGNSLCLEDGRVLQVGQLLPEGSLKELVRGVR